MKNIILKWVAPLIILSTGLLYQYLHTDSTAFARSGIVLIILGIFIEGQYFIRGKDGILILNSDCLSIPGKEELAKHHPLSSFLPGSGLFLIVVGTFISGFGDLISF
jgi:hypothetical protein